MLALLLRACIERIWVVEIVSLTAQSAVCLNSQTGYSYKHVYSYSYSYKHSRQSVVAK
jgi:hypothetical protein